MRAVHRGRQHVVEPRHVRPAGRRGRRRRRERSGARPRCSCRRRRRPAPACRRAPRCAGRRAAGSGRARRAPRASRPGWRCSFRRSASRSPPRDVQMRALPRPFSALHRAERRRAWSSVGAERAAAASTARLFSTSAGRAAPCGSAARLPPISAVTCAAVAARRGSRSAAPRRRPLAPKVRMRAPMRLAPGRPAGRNADCRG